MAATKATAKQKAYYTNQRIKAEKSGDTKTTDKIYDKLNASKYAKSKLVNADSSYTKEGVSAQFGMKKSKLGGHRGS